MATPFPPARPGPARPILGLATFTRARPGPARSILGLASSRFWFGSVTLAALAAAGCGDRCEVLCRDVSAKLDTCRGASISWADLGARSRADFVDQCRLDWDQVSGDLTSSDLSEALAICRTGSEELSTLSCDEVRVLYAP